MTTDPTAQRAHPARHDEPVAQPDHSTLPPGVRPVRVALVDDDDLVRSGLAAIIGVEPDIDVVGQAGDGADVMQLVGDCRPDVVLMDVRMPGVDGIEATRRLTTAEPRPGGLPTPPAVIVVTTFENDDSVHDALLAGARGFVLKRAQPEELIAAIRTVARTDALVFPEAIRRVAQRQATPAQPVWAARLTDRERDVLAHVARGATNAEVAAELFLSPETVKSHLSSLLAKSGSRHRTELVVRAFEGGLLSVEQ